MGLRFDINYYKERKSLPMNRERLIAIEKRINELTHGSLVVLKRDINGYIAFMGAWWATLRPSGAFPVTRDRIPIRYEYQRRTTNL